MSTQQIVPNPNFDSRGNTPALPSKQQIANATYDWVCVILEVIATRIHHKAKGTTESTTTVGLISEIGRLCLTSQNNTDFDVTLEEVREWIMDLEGLDYDHFLSEVGVSDVYGLNKKEIVKARTQKDKDSKDLIKTMNLVYYNIYPSFVRLTQIKKHFPGAFKYVCSLITNIKVIKWQHLSSFSQNGTGLHGEGRFVRYCYIRYVKDVLKDEENIEKKLVSPSERFGQIQPSVQSKPSILEDPELALAQKEYDKALSEYYETLNPKQEQAKIGLKKLKEANIGVMKIFVASSQGTCLDCQELLADLNISHNTHRHSKESPSPNWVNPFNMQSKNSNVVIDSNRASVQAKLLLEKKREALEKEEKKKRRLSDSVDTSDPNKKFKNVHVKEKK